ncbi:dephospho-CoA kinase [Alkalibacillus filiformis]|uniref:Dephospho-CoA kinase n=1 Tax=Alkalibacillus filiformis TaxID=200990 RepID=A0ABU0DSC3_9BACI|nr:dephospho-CoA kinase [Alkalibacillus filiformis]MDQ0351223.1 dephospho-CoA kinase [Alkalibacillus filiformis]
MTLVVGLTGSIATGKSTVSNMFVQWRVPVIDADKISREIVQVGEEAYEQIVATFGRQVLHEDGALNREALGNIVFQDEAERKKLNNIMHPQIRKRMLQKRDQYVVNKEPLVVMDIPLLFESELFHYVDQVLVVYVDPDIQLDRLTKRDEVSAEKALERINSQIPITEKRDRADAIVNNGGSVEESEEQLKAILKQWGIEMNT